MYVSLPWKSVNIWRGKSIRGDKGECEPANKAFIMSSPHGHVGECPRVVRASKLSGKQMEGSALQLPQTLPELKDIRFLILRGRSDQVKRI
jgi:hypothetical protein